MTKKNNGHRRMISLLAAGLLAACGSKTDEISAPATATSAPKTAAAGPAVTVVVQVAQKRDFDVRLQAIGTVIPVATVDIKAQSTSVVTGVHVQEGQSVKKGSLLFSLDARPDEANVAKLRAQMAKDEAGLADAQRQLARAKDLVAKGFVSQGASDTNQAQVDGLVATVAADRAALDAARLSLSYAQVLAPANGRLGAITIAPGSAVQANVTPLVTLTQLNPINVVFNLPQRNLQALLSGLRSGDTTVSAKLPEDKGALQGKLQFVDNAVDGATGTVKVKARFENKSEALWPGAFVNVALKAETMKDAVVIPTVAIIQTARGAIVYVNEGGKAASRPVVVVVQESEESVVTGVKPGDRVVTEGRQNLRPDAAIVEREGGAGDKKMGKGTPGEKDKGTTGAPTQPASAASQVAP
ncbi:MAG: efflux RND transporter periplasmic adaptor subunit [Candidatus Saccharibacteria bacterium]|nr:efflux RND transporter periplasmic adaptor subunit [Rhodoferax sp.]